MKNPFIKITRWIGTDSPGTNLTYSVHDELLNNYLLLDLMKSANNKIASYIARRYIENNRERIETWVKNSVVRRHIEREIGRLLSL